MVLETGLIEQLAIQFESQLTVSTRYREPLQLHNLGQSMCGSMLKRDVLHYYSKVCQNMMPYFKGQCLRPLLFAEGLHATYSQPAFQPVNLPSYVSLALDDTDAVCAVLNNEETLFYLLNMGAFTFEITPPNCLVWQIMAPSSLVPFQSLVKTAEKLEQILHSMHLSAFYKTNVIAFAADARLRLVPGNQAEWIGIDILVPFNEERPVPMADVHRFFKYVHRDLAKQLENLPHQEEIELASRYENYGSRHALAYYRAEAPAMPKGSVLKDQIYPVFPGIVVPFSLLPFIEPLVSVPVTLGELKASGNVPTAWTHQRVLNDLSNRMVCWREFYTRKNRFPYRILEDVSDRFKLGKP